MAVLLILVGAMLLVTSIRGTTADFASHLGQDVSGQFLVWVLAIVLIGTIGYAAPLRKISRLLLGLVAVVIVLKDGSGFIAQFVQQLEQAPPPAAAQPTGGSNQLPAIPVDSGSGSGSSGSGSSSGLGGSGLSASDIGTIATIAAA